MSFPGSSGGKESACNIGDPCSFPGLGRSLGEGIGYPLQYFQSLSLLAPLNMNKHIQDAPSVKLKTSLDPWPFVYLSVQFSLSVVSDSLRPHELQHARPSCPTPTPGVHSDSRLSQWCHPAISSCVVPFSSCPQSLPASQPFPMSQLFAWGGQSVGVSALASFLPKNTQGWSPSEWTGWISLQSKGLSRVFSNTTVT